MSIIDELEALTRQGTAILAELKGRNPYDVADAFQLTRREVKSWFKLADVYFGPTRSTKLQRRGQEIATNARHSVSHLKMIERHIGRLAEKPQSATCWELRIKLLEMPGSTEEVSLAAAALADATSNPPAPEPAVRFSRPTKGMQTAHLPLDERLISNLEKTLEEIRLAQAPDLARALGLGAAAQAHFSGGPHTAAAGGDVAAADADGATEASTGMARGGAGLITPRFSTLVVVGLDDFVRILAGEGDEVRLGLSDGTTMSGADYLNARLDGLVDDQVFSGLFHPSEGPVNLYETRFASRKQRLLAMAENLVCPWPDCNVPADRCEVHHIVAHNRGGHTTPSNLSMLCRYHNGTNDDDPKARPRRGRLDRHSGRVRYTSPGGRIIDNDHQVSTLGAMSLV